jgi:hypothetical protein
MASTGVVTRPSPLNCMTSRIAFGYQGVPGGLFGGRWNPVAAKTYCPLRFSFLHFFGGSPAARAGIHKSSGALGNQSLRVCSR